jgi:ketosteroid isomerase-like protein
MGVGAVTLGLVWSAPAWSGEVPKERPGVEALEAELRAAEFAFAKTMADRDHAAFTSFLADEAVFVGRDVLRGRAAVAAGWKGYFEGAPAPFSWQPERSLVVASGSLGLSSGPVYDPSGKRIGTYNSTWRREADGRWRIVLDHGCPPCDCR